MGTVLASKIAGDCAKDLFDVGYTRFTLTDWLGWINDGQNEAAILKPDIYVVTRSVALIAGIRQELADDETLLVRLVNNLGTDGQTEGLAITSADFNHFSLHNPAWPTLPTAATVEVYLFDEKDPRSFYVCPPQPSSNQGYVRRVACANPPIIADIGDPISIDDVYEPILREYAKWRAHTENAKHDASAKMEATTSWNMFVTGLGRKDLVEKAVSPNTKRKQDKVDAR